MSMRTSSLALRIAAVATALVVGPATLAPGTASAPTPGRVALADDRTTAAQTFGWRTMQWDFAWEFGESLEDPPYRGTDIRAGRWEESANGTGRVVKYGGGLEFHTGEQIGRRVGPDRGTTMLTLRDQGAVRGRWEIRERAEQSETGGPRYRFVIELIPDDPSIDPCKRSITIAEVSPGDNSVRIGATSASTRWSKTFRDGFPQNNTNYAWAVQITKRRVTWFASGKAIASTGAASARPGVPMTLRMRLIGDGTREMNKAAVKVDWVRHYNLFKGRRPPLGASLSTTTNRC